MLKVIFLDFDGVILESMDIKTNAFRELFKEYPERLNAIVEYHIKNGGLSRYKKFSYIYSNILKQPLDDEKSKALGEKFSALVLQKMLACPFVAGAQAFLKEYSKKVSLFVVSGIPQEELIFLAKERGLSIYFKGLYGAPAIKPEIMKRLLESEGVKNEEATYVGDSISDYEDAKKAGVPFIARVRESDKTDPFLEFGVPIIHDFHDLKRLLKRSHGL
jgi:phosphoglycolate phosphatase-like HAD superfamily hydrolase